MIRMISPGAVRLSVCLSDVPIGLDDLDMKTEERRRGERKGGREEQRKEEMMRFKNRRHTLLRCVTVERLQEDHTQAAVKTH